MIDIEKMAESYNRHKNLKVSAMELGMNFQTLYWHLKKNGIKVTGDKERWGSEKDRFSVIAEKEFSNIVDWAENQNSTCFQSKVDFLVNGIKVDVKAAKRQRPIKGKGGDRWMFSIKKQKIAADFFVMFAFDERATIEKIFLIPSELIVSISTISICVYGRSKWHPYEVSRDDLRNIFSEMSKINN